MRIGTPYSLLGTTCSGTHTHTYMRSHILHTDPDRQAIIPEPGCRNWLSLFTNVALSDSHISSRLIKRVGVTMSVLVCVCVCMYVCVCICECIYVGVTGVPITLMSLFHILIDDHAKRDNGCQVCPWLPPV